MTRLAPNITALIAHPTARRRLNVSHEALTEPALCAPGRYPQMVNTPTALHPRDRQLGIRRESAPRSRVAETVAELAIQVGHSRGLRPRLTSRLHCRPQVAHVSQSMVGGALMSTGVVDRDFGRVSIPAQSMPVANAVPVEWLARSK